MVAILSAFLVLFSLYFNQLPLKTHLYMTRKEPGKTSRESFAKASFAQPAAPAINKPEEERTRKDPSSSSRTDNYPIPSFFEYRIRSSAWYRI